MNDLKAPLTKEKKRNSKEKIDEEKENINHENKEQNKQRTNFLSKGEDVLLNLQNTNAYQTVEETNLYGAQLCHQILQILRSLPNYLLNICELLNLCLTIVTFLLYLANIVWMISFPLYRISYTDLNNQHQHSCLSMHCDPNDCLYHKHVCNYFGYECNNTNSNLQVQEIVKFVLIMIKVQWIFSFMCWLVIRRWMVDKNLFTYQYAGYWILGNLISYNFRHLGALYYNSPHFVVYTPYYSNAFAIGAISFVIAVPIWTTCAFCSFIQLKNPVNKQPRMVLCFCGYFADNNKIDLKSMICNIMVFSIFLYASIGPSIWIAVENMVDESIILFTSKTVSSRPLSNFYTAIDYCLITITNYLLPKHLLILPFGLVTITSTCVMILDFLIMLLKLCIALDKWLSKHGIARDGSKSMRINKNIK